MVLLPELVLCIPECGNFFSVLVLVLLNTAQTLPVGCYTAQSVWAVRLFPLDFKVSLFDQFLNINFIKFVFEYVYIWNSTQVWW